MATRGNPARGNWSGACRAVLVVAAAVSFAGGAEAARVKLVQAGNEIPSGGWCNVNSQNLAANSSANYRLDGAMDTTQYSSLNGKYRIKGGSDKFEWASGSEPSVTFNQGNATPTSFSIKA